MGIFRKCWRQCRREEDTRTPIEKFQSQTERRREPQRMEGYRVVLEYGQEKGTNKAERYK